MPSDRILILQNPGRQSRHYLLGLAAGARRAGIPCLSLELGPIWQQAAGPDAARVLASVRSQLADLVCKHRITHAIGYIFNGTHDLGLVDGRTIWDELGIRHILLWTDHPEWAIKGCALDPPLCGSLGGSGRIHILKSESAATEAAHILSWPNVHALAMAEEYPALASASTPKPIHDAIAIVGDAAAPPTPTLPFLDEDDPDPTAIDRLMRSHSERTWLKVVGAEHDALLSAWLDLKLAHPDDSYWRLATELEMAHHDSLHWLRAEPRRWYIAVAALRRMVGWRRNFWLAWLGRRINLGLYGSPAAALGIPQPPGADAWVDYARQSEVYARGRAAININAPHDEEGLTHKPFQIAASGIPCIHHAVRGLDECFVPGREVLTFRRGPELLACIRAASDDRPRADLGAAMRRRAAADHTWEARLGPMLTLAPATTDAKPRAAAGVGTE